MLFHRISNLYACRKVCEQKFRLLCSSYIYCVSKWHLNLCTIKFVLSLCHCSIIWDSTPKTTLRLLNSVQRRALCIVNSRNLTGSLQSLVTSFQKKFYIFYRYYRHYSEDLSTQFRQLQSPTCTNTTLQHPHYISFLPAILYNHCSLLLFKKKTAI